MGEEKWLLDKVEELEAELAAAERRVPPKPTKKLVLTIVVHGIWADDLPDSAAIWAETDEPTPRDYLNVVLEEWMRSDIGVTLVSLPGDKCMNDDFIVSAHDATIIGAGVKDV